RLGFHHSHHPPELGPPPGEDDRIGKGNRRGERYGANHPAEVPEGGISRKREQSQSQREYRCPARQAGSREGGGQSASGQDHPPERRDPPGARQELTVVKRRKDVAMDLGAEGQPRGLSHEEPGGSVRERRRVHVLMSDVGQADDERRAVKLWGG